jgi:hypothetical protein
MVTFISKQDLFERINRVLESDESEIKKTDDFGQVYKELGEYYMIYEEPVYDVKTVTLIEPHVNLEELGRSLGVLKADERLQPQSNASGSAPKD